MQPSADHDSGLTYATYLRLPHVLDQQRCRSSPPAHDELLFITVHQVYELWFKVLLFELSNARDRMLDGDAYRARLRLRRCHEIERVLVNQIDVVDTMTPHGFLEFRGTLGSSSGLQSTQFREIEFLSGADDSGWLDRAVWLSTEDHQRLSRRLTEPDLWDSFITLLAVAGFAVGTPQQRAAIFYEIAVGDDRYNELWELSEALIDHDQMWSTWRLRHQMTVVRQLGGKPGTGGSTGGGYLAERVPMKFYPELWEARSRFGPPNDGSLPRVHAPESLRQESDG
ncbi:MULTISPECIES: tryptophan 2,3-dioxygenase family protein [Protofrankia]|uniref:Tryptophan 2,3-dioxygenase n=1 Tax=Protofrankia coriariae TaxID=1562887 RepID=A0ABR5F0R3_9ACTN|nr:MULTISPECIES: tryptophan 2,3-dioxygenase family protein [Protofrankia]KLL10272.1 tryptophan 2,3-dioxygenase [Protofrankia coriariae]ONH32707.1 tryptophan 2,3-dioxygenase [Protofrankia sp. BMG5.30]